MRAGGGTRRGRLPAVAAVLPLRIVSALWSLTSGATYPSSRWGRGGNKEVGTRFSERPPWLPGRSLSVSKLSKIPLAISSSPSPLSSGHGHRRQARCSHALHILPRARFCPLLLGEPPHRGDPRRRPPPPRPARRRLLASSPGKPRPLGFPYWYHRG